MSLKFIPPNSRPQKQTIKSIKRKYHLFFLKDLEISTLQFLKSKLPQNFCVSLEWAQNKNPLFPNNLAFMKIVNDLTIKDLKAQLVTFTKDARNVHIRGVEEEKVFGKQLFITRIPPFLNPETFEQKKYYFSKFLQRFLGDDQEIPDISPESKDFCFILPCKSASMRSLIYSFLNSFPLLDCLPMCCSDNIFDLPIISISDTRNNKFTKQILFDIIGQYCETIDLKNISYYKINQMNILVLDKLENAKLIIRNFNLAIYSKDIVSAVWYLDNSSFDIITSARIILSFGNQAFPNIDSKQKFLNSQRNELEKNYGELYEIKSIDDSDFSIIISFKSPELSIYYLLDHSNSNKCFLFKSSQRVLLPITFWDVNNANINTVSQYLSQSNDFHVCVITDFISIDQKDELLIKKEVKALIKQKYYKNHLGDNQSIFPTTFYAILDYKRSLPFQLFKQKFQKFLNENPFYNSFAFLGEFQFLPTEPIQKYIVETFTKLLPDEISSHLEEFSIFSIKQTQKNKNKLIMNNVSKKYGPLYLYFKFNNLYYIIFSDKSNKANFEKNVCPLKLMFIPPKLLTSQTKNIKPILIPPTSNDQAQSRNTKNNDDGSTYKSSLSFKIEQPKPVSKRQLDIKKDNKDEKIELETKDEPQKVDDVNENEIIYIDEEQYKNYDMVESIGHGGQGTVDKYRNKTTGELFAVKTFTAQLSLMKEFEILKYLNHPCIVSVHGIHFNTGQLFLELLDCDLESLLQDKKNPISPVDKVLYVLDIAFGMEYVHFNGLIHRDIKPLNILLDLKNHRAKISDLGAARDDSDTSTKTFISSGYNWLFNPPEVINEENDYNCSIDVYAFGIILLYMATGELPMFKIIDKLNRKPIPIPNNEKVTPVLKTLVLSCTYFNPRQRPTFSDIIEKIHKAKFKLFNNLQSQDFGIIQKRFEELQSISKENAENV
ncbi:hypothetical protein TRFO_14955 [Tritrichomonas foetus]|uniref:Protein kinase domain-containing protein n=1 Tax=Tritrichomonas foetus TaxID=1144522 RepID=A0A1J4KUV4_9EUKA|nr:hypothetical protein TRFO_14955 [Tritrichomonas foetus]|eukprot:OHT14648.1 hypothetical protein TRFO_14955 [Tritrichomonas foetus]